MLAGLAAQQDSEFAVLISDQSDAEPSYAAPAAQAMIRQLRRTGHPVETTQHLPRRGLAEHRQFLLDSANADQVLFLDDDVWLAPDVLSRLGRALIELDCGFVGNAMQGLSFLDDKRPDELTPYQEWDGPVEPEQSTGTDRWMLHNAANLIHLADQLDLRPGEWRPYHVAWIAGCVLFDRRKLLDCGGFDFWTDLPAEHAGEDVAAQRRVLARHGGAGILPSGAVHLEAPTTVPDRDNQAIDLLPEFSASTTDPAPRPAPRRH